MKMLGSLSKRTGSPTFVGSRFNASGRSFDCIDSLLAKTRTIDSWPCAQSLGVEHSCVPPVSPGLRILKPCAAPMLISRGRFNAKRYVTVNEAGEFVRPACSRHNLGQSIFHVVKVLAMHWHSNDY